MTAIKDIIVARLTGRSCEEPLSLPDNLATEAVNVDWFNASLARKRNGSTNLTLNGFNATSVAALGRFAPSTETTSELWAVETNIAATMQRLAGGTTWATVTLADAIQANWPDVSFATLNGKFFMAYNSSVNRLHVWDGTTHRRAGLKPPSGAPTIVETAGSVIEKRKYKTAATVQSGGVTLRRSELSPISAEADLIAQRATVTHVGMPGEGETHWELYAAHAIDNYAVWYRIGTAAIGTATQEDNNVILTGEAPPDIGQNTVPPSAKYLIAGDARLIMAGAWETTVAGTYETIPSPRRVWWTDVLGSSDVGDDERVTYVFDQRDYLDVEVAITGLGGPIEGASFIFAYRRIWKIVGTGNDDAPFVRYTVSQDIGCIRHQTIVLGEDDSGSPTLYFLSHVGPYAVSVNGFQYLGRDIEDIWQTVNLDAAIVGHGIYHRDKHQVWWWVATAGSNDPNLKLVFDVRLGTFTSETSQVRGGWCQHTGPSAIARCSVMYAKVIGATTSHAVIPYIGKYDGDTTPRIWQCDTTATNDSGTTFQGYVQTKPFAPWGYGLNGGIQRDPYLLAKVSNGVTIQLTLVRDHGKEYLTSFANLTGSLAGETRGTFKCEGQSLSQASVVQFRVGDAVPNDDTWTLDILVVPLRDEGPR